MHMCGAERGLGEIHLLLVPCHEGERRSADQGRAMSRLAASL